MNEEEEEEKTMLKETGHLLMHSQRVRTILRYVPIKDDDQTIFINQKHNILGRTNKNFSVRVSI